jgi:anti-anti-sigma regulatory factor
LVTQSPTPVRWFVLDAQAMVDVDTTGAGVLGQAITMLKKRNITFAVSRADGVFRSWLEKYELMGLIDRKRFYPTNRHAADAFRRETAGAPAPDRGANS